MTLCTGNRRSILIICSHVTLTGIFRANFKGVTSFRRHKSSLCNRYNNLRRLFTDKSPLKGSVANLRSRILTDILSLSTVTFGGVPLVLGNQSAESYMTRLTPAFSLYRPPIDIPYASFYPPPPPVYPAAHFAASPYYRGFAFLPPPGYYYYAIISIFNFVTHFFFFTKVRSSGFGRQLFGGLRRTGCTSTTSSWSLGRTDQRGTGPLPAPVPVTWSSVLQSTDSLLADAQSLRLGTPRLEIDARIESIRCRTLVILRRPENHARRPQSASAGCS